MKENGKMANKMEEVSQEDWMAHIFNLTLLTVKLKDTESMFTLTDLIILVNSRMEPLMEKENSFINSTKWLMKDNGKMESPVEKVKNISQVSVNMRVISWMD